jgi:hypothetical protein
MARIGLLACLLAALGALIRLVLDGYALGFMDGVLATALVALVLTAFHASTGSIWQLAGAWGEENTRDVLRAAKRRRHIWGWIDSVAIADGDIDHLVVTRDGRLVAIDSKWHATASKVDWNATQRTQSAQLSELVQYFALWAIPGRYPRPSSFGVAAQVTWSRAPSSMASRSSLDPG